MRIGIDARELQPVGLTGIGRYLRNFLGYARTATAEHEYHLVGHHRPDDLGLGHRGQFHQLPHAPTLLEDHVVLPMCAARESLDVFFSPYYKCPWDSPAPAVIVIHDLHFLGTGLTARLGRRYVQALAARAARIVTVSEYTKRTILETLGPVVHARTVHSPTAALSPTRT